MSQLPAKDFVAASLAALDLPADPETVDTVTTHFVRLSGLSALVMALPIPDDIETPSIFEP